MKIMKKKYVIATKDFPLKFIDRYGNRVDAIEDAYLYNNEEDANAELNKFFDHVITVNVTYEF